MNFILKNWVRYCTKEVFKTLKIVTIGSAMIITVACVKYKPAYKVTLAGNTIGFISNREIIEAKISKYINDTTGNIAFREINELPEYEFKLINRDKKTDTATDHRRPDPLSGVRPSCYCPGHLTKNTPHVKCHQEKHCIIFR